uniref:Uncharacterized protein n=1 Tax=Trichobilharzia regenti TaxID=157069 RepID=A0AA85KI12_TRIRE|nr:unnamed protein product [Trichobilharzia regenti]
MWDPISHKILCINKLKISILILDRKDKLSRGIFMSVCRLVYLLASTNCGGLINNKPKLLIQLVGGNQEIIMNGIARDQADYTCASETTYPTGEARNE